MLFCICPPQKRRIRSILHIKAELSCPLIAGSEIRSEIAVEKFHAELFSETLACRGYKLVLLVNACEKRGCKLLKTVFRRKFGCFAKPRLIAIGTPVIYIIDNIFHEFAKSVILFDQNPHIYFRSIVDKAITPCLVFFPRVDVWIIPKCDRLYSLVSQRVYAGKRARRTAAVKKHIIHRLCHRFYAYPFPRTFHQSFFRCRAVPPAKIRP